MFNWGGRAITRYFHDFLKVIILIIVNFMESTTLNYRQEKNSLNFDSELYS